VRSRIFLALALALFATFAVSCRSYVPPARGGAGAIGPTAAVERFMRHAAAKEYAQMGWIFGTAQGPLIRRDPPADVERRMYALATVLEHTSFVVQGEAPVPGRAGAAVQLPVRLVQRGREYLVPITAVRGPEGRWFIEQIGVEAITAQTPAVR
jgi:hypothetical protein